jgi:ribonuclease P protein subunit POP4
MITAKNLVKHELIGLQIKVTKSTNKSQEMIGGMVVDETKSMLKIETKNGIKGIAKKTSEFIFTIPSGKKVKVDGKKIFARPEDRIKLKVKKW